MYLSCLSLLKEGATANNLWPIKTDRVLYAMLCYATSTNSTELDVTALMLIKTVFSDLPLFRGISNTAITSTGEKTYTDLNQYCWGDPFSMRLRFLFKNPVKERIDSLTSICRNE